MSMSNQWNNPDGAGGGMSYDNYNRYAQMLGLAGGAATAGAGAYGLYNNRGKNPGQIASNQLDKIPAELQQYYTPYQQAGKDAMGTLKNEYGDLLSGNKQNQLGANFKESPGYQFALQQALGAGANAQARGGMLGTPQDQQESQRVAQGYASQDYDKYMQNQVGLYGQGLTGTQTTQQQGYNADMDYANMLANVRGQQTEYGYQGNKGQNSAKSSAAQNIFKGIGMAAGTYFGGPAGGAAGSAGADWLYNTFGG